MIVDKRLAGIADLKEVVYDNLEKKGVRKNWLTRKFGMTRTGLNGKLERKGFSEIEVDFLEKEGLID